MPKSSRFLPDAAAQHQPRQRHVDSVDQCLAWSAEVDFPKATGNLHGQRLE